MNDKKYRITVVAVVLIIAVACVALTFAFPVKTSFVKRAGGIASVILVALITFKLPRRIFNEAMIFAFLAAPLGSTLNLYYYIGFYDRFVHFFSGIVLADAGACIISAVMRKRNFPQDRLIVGIFAFLFSASCAAFWEIYEFTADNLLGISMQGSGENTMGDIISGVLGGILWCAVSAVCEKARKKSR